MALRRLNLRYRGEIEFSSRAASARTSQGSAGEWYGLELCRYAWSEDGVDEVVVSEQEVDGVGCVFVWANSISLSLVVTCAWLASKEGQRKSGTSRSVGSAPAVPVPTSAARAASTPGDGAEGCCGRRRGGFDDEEAVVDGGRMGC